MAVLSKQKGTRVFVEQEGVALACGTTTSRHMVIAEAIKTLKYTLPPKGFAPEDEFSRAERSRLSLSVNMALYPFPYDFH